MLEVTVHIYLQTNLLKKFGGLIHLRFQNHHIYYVGRKIANFYAKSLGGSAVNFYLTILLLTYTRRVKRIVHLSI